MQNLDQLLQRKRWAVLGCWGVLLLLAFPLAARQSERLTGAFNVPGSESNQVRVALQQDFERTDGEDVAAVLVPAPGSDAPDLVTAIDRIEAAADEVDDVDLADAANAAAVTESAGGRTVIVPLRVTVEGDRADTVAGDLRDELGIDGDPEEGVTTHLIGEGALNAAVLDTAREDATEAERLTFPVLLLILVIVFGSLIAALLPISLALISITITGAAIFLLSGSFEMSVFSLNMASLIGIGVAVDYSLFVLARYREDVATGQSPDAARVKALSTSGVAVLFSGIAVVISLSGLFLVHNTALRSMAAGAMIVIAVAVATALLLLPVLIKLLGRRGYAPGRISELGVRLMARFRRGRGRAERRPLSARWTTLITGRPAVSLAVATAILLLLAVPALSMKIRAGLLPQLQPDSEARAGVEAAAAASGPTAATPTYVLLDFDEGTADDAANGAAIAEARRIVAEEPLSDELQPTRISRDGDSAVIQFGLTVQAETEQAKQMVGSLCDRLSASPAADAGSIAVGGIAARWYDVERETSSSIWKVFAFVLGLAFIALVALLRAPVVAAKAVLMVLLSVGAAYGVLVAVFQWGWLAEPLGLDDLGYIDPAVPPLVFAIVFGLSMDYQVFLLTRIRERWQAHGDSRRAVAEALTASSRTITSAAIIIAVVFATFAFTGVSTVQQTGIGCAAAILIDASLVRMVMVPASMQLLGDWNWWQPAWMRRRAGPPQGPTAITTPSGS